MREYEPAGDRGADVPDPYYGGPYEFDQVYAMLRRCCERLLEELQSPPAPPGP
jgi:protein-tyrosine phosphatase